MQLLKQTIALPELLGVTEDAEQHREDLIVAGQAITSITNAIDNNTAREATVAMRAWVKDVKAMGLAIRRPIDAVTAQVKRLEDDHLAPITSEINRLERLATAFLEAEQARVAAEMKARLELAAEAKTDEDFATISNEALPVMDKARGQTMRQKLCYEVTDIMALVKARPDLCKIEAKASAINSTCIPEVPVPGLRLWWENQSTYTSR